MIFPKKEFLVLTKDNQIEETLFLGLRMTEGIEKKKFHETFRVSVDTVYGGVLEKLKGKGLIEEDEKRIRLTPRGIDVSNYVLAEFLL